MTGTQEFERTLGRRTVVAAVGAAGLAVALTACGGSEDGSSDSVRENGAEAGAGADGSAELAKTADIPEGGGKLLDSEGVVITQPKAGEFKAFSSKCTHQGCSVVGVTDGSIVCPCHNSKFSVTDGSVQAGPATQPLPAVSITVEGDVIKKA
ncbi:Rieske (2Fe-2S) protein [Streptomyces sp. GC420]|uniref:Rieske (2Fe-2S) protein n=1 Tax=Streptomyces sp. GC420 TaxID=2697568 RepID=UPI0014150419|nr:Rieske (2Fe-2S) protein [Streptomyces sp. GC420]NBM16427.1 Rieske 2Fe-2S domain-containing protein [Streptomyces sp. GC420]